MLIVQICVGSSCHLKGSADIAELFQKSIEENGIQDDVVLTGSLCIGKSNATQNTQSILTFDTIYS